ncbi:DUF3667 domain-containing protein [Flavobacterium silvaticum]|uniref:DUF3667 domain-containing protein n=1 Tax=Flavobacterium silvaticum TaxID=1852020 RepID=A0A972FL28_9FLAO|nr:DUF3667 domain-containing protein [Flavobacterium silvaticum]NMH27946.1 DUF3667 domain-containing protein [Flavobacterium silvaticum]
MSQCLNCEETIVANFCPNCGQKKFKRIDRKYLIDELQYSVIHTNKGFFYSVKKILLNPGKTAREFIDGNRVNHYKPILMAFTLVGITTFVSYKILGLQNIMKEVYAAMKINDNVSHDVITFLSSYNSAMMLAFIPLVSAFSAIAFRKWGQNYYEHIIMNTYGLCFYTLFSLLVIYPVMYLTRHEVQTFMTVSMLSSTVVLPIMVWFYKQFYYEKSLVSIIIRVLLMFVAMFILFVIAIFASVILFVIIKGPEAAAYFKPKQ